MTWTRLRVTTLTLASVAVVLAGCTTGGSTASTAAARADHGPTVSIKSLAFMPDTLHVRTGDTVTWRNDEPVTHTVTSGRVTGVDKTTGLRAGAKPDGLFDAKLTGMGDTFSYTFEKAGTYSYYCDIHFGMYAHIVVTP